MTYADDQIQRILLEHHFCATAKDIQSKWGVSAHQLRKWKKTRPCPWTLHDVIIAGIYQREWFEPADLVRWLDYRDHATYSSDEIRALLETLEQRGEVRRDGDRWQYVQADPPYIFGPRSG